MSIVIALIIFGVLVLIHEFGHFIVAKKNGIVVNEFSIGMGPRIFSFDKGGTKYSLKILPFGGSCAMLGEDEDVVVEGSFNSKSVWARMAVVFAGPFFNFILAWVLALVILGYNGVDLAYVTEVKEGSKAYEAGLREGDQILEYNGAHAVLAREIGLENNVNPLDGSDMEIVYKRNGQKYTATYEPDSTEVYLVGMMYSGSDSEATITTVTKGSAIEKAGAIAGDVVIEINGHKISSGIELGEYLDANPLDGSEVAITLLRNKKEVEVTLKPEMTKIYSQGFSYNVMGEKQSAIDSIKYSFTEVRYQIALVLKSLKMLVFGEVSANEMSGPIGIVATIGDVYNETKPEGIMYTLITMLSMATMLSANLGVMNLLPIPALDGGRLLLLIIEAIRRKPIDREKEGIFHFIGFILLMILMVFLVYNDIRKLFF